VVEAGIPRDELPPPPRPNAKKSAAMIAIAATPEAPNAAETQSVRLSSAVRRRRASTRRWGAWTFLGGAGVRAFLAKPRAMLAAAPEAS
jgi:hypothetical protein